MGLIIVQGRCTIVNDLTKEDFSEAWCNAFRKDVVKPFVILAKSQYSRQLSLSLTVFRLAHAELLGDCITFDCYSAEGEGRQYHGHYHFDDERDRWIEQIC